MYVGWWLVVFILPFITSTAAIIIACVSVIIVYGLAPVPHVNVKMSDKQKLKMRALARIVVTVGALTSIVLILSTYRPIGIAMSTGLGVSSLSIMIAHCKNMLIGTGQ
jgi:hypothetical protein